MKVKVYFTVFNHQDYFIVEGENVEEIKEKVKKEMEKRDLHIVLNDMWTEVI